MLDKTRIRRIARIAFRILLTSFMLVVVVGAGVWGWGELGRRRLERSVSVTKTWSVKSMPLKPALTVELKTRCAGEVLYYVVTLTPSDKPIGALNPVTQRSGVTEACTALDFLDTELMVTDELLG